MRTHFDKYGQPLDIGNVVMYTSSYKCGLYIQGEILEFEDDIAIITSSGQRFGIPQQYAVKLED